MNQKSINWQPISQLPLFASLVEKMVHDTQLKLNLLKQVKKGQANIVDAELANILHVLHRQIENYAPLVEQFKRWRGQNPTSTELQLIDTALMRNEIANKLTRECQDAAGGLVNSTLEAQEMTNETGSSSSNIEADRDKYCSKQKYSLTDEQVSYYKKLRNMLHDLHPKFIANITKEAVDRCGKRLEILQGNSLLLNTAHESDLFFDYCMHTYKISGSNCIQQSFKRFATHYDGEMLKVFEIAKDAYFAYLEIIEPIGESGLVVYDRLRDREHLMIDNGLNKVANNAYKYTIVTFVMDFDDFIITTGASTPVPIHTEEGIKVQRRFDEYLALSKSGKTTTKDDAQYITDMYKICLHEDITGNVASSPVPFGREELKKRVMSSSSMH